MSDTELIVPVEIHALLVNETVRKDDPFYRAQPSFRRMLGTNTARAAAEPEPFQEAKAVTAAFEGVHVHWQLPEALTDGFLDEAEGETRFPLVPNRWLVVRYAQVDGEHRPPVGWIVQSDCTESAGDEAPGTEFPADNSFLNPRADTPEEDWIGGLYPLSRGPWREPANAQELFLTAVGAGLPTFAAYEPYHETVFSMHDKLTDLKQGGVYLDATLSYLVVGWYSDPAKDILRTAAGIPGLLPEGSDGSPADVIAALGWAPASPIPTATCTIPGHGDSTPGHCGPVEAILDGSDDTWFETAAAPTAADHVTVDLGALHRVTTVTTTFGTSRGGEQRPPAKKLQASADGSTWTDLATAAADDEQATWPMPDTAAEPVTARYLRLQMTAAAQAPTVIRNLGYTATAVAPDAERCLFSGTALGLVWEHKGDAPRDDRPTRDPLKVALGHSTGEAAAALVGRQTRSADTAQLFSALYHGTLDTFDGAQGSQDLDETTRHSWFSGSESGAGWHIQARPGAATGDTPARSAEELTPAWLAQLNTDQAAYDAVLPVLADQRWRLWALYWLKNLPTALRPPTLDPDFDTDAARELDPANSTGLAATVRAQRDRAEALREKLPQTRPDPDDPAEDFDPQDAIDAFAAAHGLPAHLQLTRTPGDSFYKPADPVLLIEGSAGTPRPLTRDEDNPLPCRTTATLLSQVRIGDQWTSPPGNPPDPGTADLPDPCARLLAEFALLEQAATTTDSTGNSALRAITSAPLTHARGALAEYTAPWRQPWLPMLLQWKLNYFPTPYRTGDDDYHWTFQAPPDGTADAYSYTWNGTGAPEADTESEGDRLSRMFVGRAFLAPTTAFVARAQLARYLATYPSADVAALGELREEFEGLDVLSQSLDGFNDWLLQLDGGAQVATEAAVASLAGDQNHVPDGAAVARNQRFAPVRAGQFAFTDLRIVDRFGRVLDIVTSGDGGTSHDQYPVLTRSVTPNRELYDRPVNPERFVQLPPRLLQDTRLAFTPQNGATVRTSATPVTGWLLVNYLDQTLAVYAPDGLALGELRVTTTTAGPRTTFTQLPHSAYTGNEDPRFTEDHPDLAEFLQDLLAHDADAFEDLTATIDRSLSSIVDPVPSDDQLPSRLIGRPVALIRADLALQLQGPPLADPSWIRILDPLDPDYTDPDYTDYTWAIRLGDPHDLDDGLVGYFAADPDRPVDYRRLHAVDPATPTTSTGYVQPIGNGDDLALAARPATRPTVRHLTLLAHPHLPVHATTGILPVQQLRLDADLVHHALANIRASFRLNPVLATTRTNRTATSSIPGHGGNTPQAGPVDRILDGRDDTWYQTADGLPPKVRAGDWVQVDLGAEREVSHVHVQLGEIPKARTAPAKKLQASADATDWTDLASAGANDQDLSWHPAGPGPRPLNARYLRLYFTANSDTTTVVRNFHVTCTPDDASLVLPPLSARYGTWSWAQPVAGDTALLDWDTRPLVPADQLTHPDDDIPTARAGYLQLEPATAAAQDEPQTPARTRHRPGAHT